MSEKCINCGISNVPLYTGLDGHLHCENHIQILVGAGQAKQENNVNNKNVKEKET